MKDFLQQKNVVIYFKYNKTMVLIGLVNFRQLLDILNKTINLFCV